MWMRALVATAMAATVLAPACASATARILDHGWQVRLAPGDPAAATHPRAAHWLPAHVPGTVQTDLMAVGLVADPNVGTREAAIQWVGLADWQYRLRFHVPPSLRAHRHVVLVFDGLDTFADVRLNGHHVLAADNMFRRWRAPVRRWLHDGDNTLTVTVHSPIRRVQRWLVRQPYALPGEFDSAFGDEPKGRQSANYVRKAAYQYGWDWGPRIVTEGIWQPVRLQAWNGLRLDDLHIAQRHVDAAAARLDAQLTLAADAAGRVHVRIDARGPHGRRVAHVARDLRVAAGTHTVTLPLVIGHPRRWYPAGYGAQPMYTFTARVTDARGRVRIVASRHRAAQHRPAPAPRSLGALVRVRGQRHPDLRQGRQPGAAGQLPDRA